MKEKKEKVQYIDDGRTIADMSGVQGGFTSKRNNGGYRAPLREQLRTFWEAFKMMLLPMLVFLIGLVIVYGIMYLLLKLA